jgi:hypothetical protein
MRQTCSEAANRMIHAVGGQGMKPQVLELPQDEILRARWARLRQLKEVADSTQRIYNKERAELLAAIGGKAFQVEADV